MTAPSLVLDFKDRGAVIVVPNDKDFASYAAETFLTVVQGAVYARGHAFVALSGGSTPKAMGERLSREPLVTRIPWRDLDIFWGDERWAPLESDESNAGVAKRTFLDQVSIPAKQVHPFQTIDLEPQASAAQMEAKIRSVLPAREFPPRFDLVLLGMGDDGHTASLFPGTRAIHEDKQLVVANEVEKLNSVRLTFTPPLLNAAYQVVFLVSGSAKSTMLNQVLLGELQPDILPSQIVRPANGTLTWIVDEAAAAELSGAL